MRIVCLVMALACAAASPAAAYDFRNPLYVGVFPGFEAVVLGAATLIGFLLTGLEADDPGSHFRGNAFYLSLQVGAYPGYERSGSALLDCRIGGGFYLLSWFALGAEFSVSHESDEGTNTTGLGGLLHMRWRIPVANELALFFDYGFGMNYSVAPYPTGGTAWNFTPIYGLGLGLRIAEMHSLVFGVRHFHISNGGRANNPGFSANGFFMGYEIN